MAPPLVPLQRHLRRHLWRHLRRHLWRHLRRHLWRHLWRSGATGATSGATSGANPGANSGATLAPTWRQSNPGANLAPLWRDLAPTLEHGAAPTWRQPWRHPNTNLAPTLAPTQIWYQAVTNLVRDPVPPRRQLGANPGATPDLVPDLLLHFWFQPQKAVPHPRDVVPGLVPDAVPPFGAGSELAFGNSLYRKNFFHYSRCQPGGGPGRSGTRGGTAFLGLVPDLVPRPGTRCGTTFWGWNQRCGTRPGTRCGTAAFSKNIPDLDYGLVPGPGTRCGTTFWDWNQRCGIRPGTTFWEREMWYQACCAAFLGWYRIWYHGLVPGHGTWCGTNFWGWNQRCGSRFGTF